MVCRPLRDSSSRRPGASRIDRVDAPAITTSWNGTLMATRQLGTSLSLPSTRVRQIALVATTCSTCGRVAIYAGSRRVVVDRPDSSGRIISGSPLAACRPTASRRCRFASSAAADSSRSTGSRPRDGRAIPPSGARLPRDGAISGARGSNFPANDDRAPIPCAPPYASLSAFRRCFASLCSVTQPATSRPRRAALCVTPQG